MNENDINFLGSFINIEAGSVLGINYSGMHDSAVAIVAPDGKPVFAVSLERISRVKQDGRTLDELFKAIPWDRIAKVAISTPEVLREEFYESQVLTVKLPHLRALETLKHGKGFYDALNLIPCEKVFVGHQDAHASSAFWGSGFDESLCLTYDGGMFNDQWFGGVYNCSKTNGIQPLDRFNALIYAKVSTLYSFVTALLGFMPLRHEGKITGLAAFGKPTYRCEVLLNKWFELDYYELENAFQWSKIYSATYPPRLLPVKDKLSGFRAQIDGISKEELAASIQDFSERHILKILSNIELAGWKRKNICLAGGLFANVKINQKIVEYGFDQLFVAPPMTDEGTALGAAWQVASTSDRFKPMPLHSMFIGPTYSKVQNLNEVYGNDIQFSVPECPERTIADLLASGAVVAVFQGGAEFGPRSLGNRSILAQATEVGINQSLNARLNRTEFMPFAPMTLDEDAEVCYHGIEHIRHAAEFMTVTANCTDIMKSSCPAVVHVDGTARPQLVNSTDHPLMHRVLTTYKEITNNLAIVNTSFNVHEEPIVCSPKDALRGFFESGLDFLYMEGVGVISFDENLKVANKYLRDKLKIQDKKFSENSLSVIELLQSELHIRNEIFLRASKDLVERTAELVDLRRLLIDRTEQMERISSDLNERTADLVDVRKLLIDRTEQMERISSDLNERTADLVDVRNLLIDRTEQLEGLAKDIIERTTELNDVRQLLIERTAQLERLSKYTKN
jgi:carbamoyltransferase